MRFSNELGTCSAVPRAAHMTFSLIRRSLSHWSIFCCYILIFFPEEELKEERRTSVFDLHRIFVLRKLLYFYYLYFYIKLAVVQLYSLINLLKS